ncbi:MAG: DNA-3-methyladenine glycosylase [Puniceicoccales bacterium]|jgi:DNA-3-methyladenine glycosylase|nr:DNA-3-methyladenine glycosylase [Puniceicoccales bacterium]
MPVLDVSFYSRDTLVVARELLGQVLCRSTGTATLRGRVVETEGYTPDDPASHSFRGRTGRTEAMFQRPGTAYIYFIYGMYHCLNIVTERENFGSAVLIRALEGLGGLSEANGPGKLCRAMGIGMEHNGCDVTCESGKIWVERDAPISAEDVVQTTRIGIRRAANYPRRFYIRGNKSVSKFN